MRALRADAGLLLDDRGERDELLLAPDRQVGRARGPGLVDDRLLVGDHALQERGAGRATREDVGLGPHRAFGRLGRDRAFEDLVLGQPLDDLIAGQAFRDRDPVLDRPAGGEEVDEPVDAGARRHLVLALLELSCDAARLDGPHEEELGIDRPYGRHVRQHALGYRGSVRS